MSNLTFKQLRYFEALARHGHFGRAADDCAISQPALSMQIKEMEQTLGTELFERGSRKIRLTAFGEEIAARVNDIVRKVDELEDLARASATVFAGKFKLGIIPTIAPYFLPSIIKTLNEAYPQLDISVRETLTDRLVEELHDGKLDTAIVALPISENTFHEVALFKEEFVLVRHSANRHDPVPDRDALKEMKLLLLEEGHCFRDQALSFCDLGSGGPREGLDGSTLSTLVQMVAAGIGVTLIPEMAVPIETRSAAVAVSNFDGLAPARTVGMIWRKTNPLSDKLLEISEVLRG